MASNRFLLAWNWVKPAAEADASFFEDGVGQCPRPGSPVNFFITRAEEAESHLRWARALVRQKFGGPITSTEQLALGIYAAALLALLDLDRPPPVDIDGEHAAADPRSILVAWDGTLADVRQDDAAIEPLHAVLDTGWDASSFGEGSGFADVRRVPRGSGAPIENWVSGPERTEFAAPRKTELLAGDVRAPFSIEGAFTGRSPMEAEIFATALSSDAPETGLLEARKAQVQAKAKDANVAETRADGGEGRDRVEATGQARENNVVEARAGQDQRLIEVPGQVKTHYVPAVFEARPYQGSDSAQALRQAEAKDVDVFEAEAEQDQHPTEAPGPATAKDVAVVVEATSYQGRDRAEASWQAKNVGIVETKAEQSRAATEASGQVKTKDVSAESPVQVKAKDILAVVGAKPDQSQGSIEAPGQVKAKDVPAVVEIKVAQGPAETPGQVKAKDVLAVVEVKTEQGLATTEALGQVKAIPAVVGAKPDQTQASTEAPGQVKAKEVLAVVEAKANGVQGPAEASGQVKQADLSGQAPSLVQHTGLVQDGDAAVRGILAGLVTDAIVIDVARLWPENEGRSEHSQTYALPVEKGTSPILHANNLVGANGGQSTGTKTADSGGKAATSSTRDELPSDAATAFTFGFGEQGGADAVRAAPSKPEQRSAGSEPAARSDAGGSGALDKSGQGAPEGASDQKNGLLLVESVPDASRTPLSQVADPVGTKVQNGAKSANDQAVAKLSTHDDSADGVVRTSPVAQGREISEALAIFSPTVSEDVVTRPAARTASKGLASDFAELGTSAPESAWHAATSDLVLL